MESSSALLPHQFGSRTNVYDFAVLFSEPHLNGPAVTSGFATHALLNVSGVAVSDFGISGWNRLCQSVYVLANLTIVSWSSVPRATDAIWSKPWVVDTLYFAFLPFRAVHMPLKSSQVSGVPSLHLALGLILYSTVSGLSDVFLIDVK